MIFVTKENKSILIDKLIKQTQSGILIWDKIGHHRLSPPVIERYIQNQDGQLFFEDSTWAKCNDGYFYLLHFVYINSEKDEDIFKTLSNIHGIFEIPDEEFFNTHPEKYSLVVQADDTTFPEAIPPAGDPMLVELKTLSDIIHKSMQSNQKFIDSFLSD